MANPPNSDAAARRCASIACAAAGHHLDAIGKNQIVNLLSVAFAERDPPSGVVTLTFSGEGALRLEVECLEIELADLGPVWTTETRPAHGLDALQRG